LFSAFANLLMLTGPLYMLQIYDRVLGSRSVETLLALTLLVAFLYGIMGLLDYSRGRIMARIGVRFQARLDQRVFDAAIRKSAVDDDDLSGTGLRDLEAVQRLMTSPALMSVFDIPWTAVFLAGIWVFHPFMGMLALGGGALLIITAMINRWISQTALVEANIGAYQADKMSDQIQHEAEMIQSMGMLKSTFEAWKLKRSKALLAQLAASDVSSVFSNLTKIFRLFLQSAMLGLGAYLALQNKVSPGAMIASSILMGRALAPVEMLINQWALFQRSRKGWNNLALLLSQVPPEVPKTALPRPAAKLTVRNLTVVPPRQDRAALKMVNFMLEPGQALGVIGPSGCGKTTLARAITGVWRPAGGSLKLDSAALDQYDQAVLGGYIGYLPQRVHLFDSTIAQNIAKMALSPDPEKIVIAAKKAAAHEMILDLPDGYDSLIGDSGVQLSGGQMQRVGLARALYGDPVLLVLDEPNSNLDNDGNEALNIAIRGMKAQNKSVLIMAHRPAAIKECDLLLVLNNGAQSAFGPREDILKSTVQNHQTITTSGGPGGLI
jgi:PrtD family type I secretion system ABC transporter